MITRGNNRTKIFRSHDDYLKFNLPTDPAGYEEAGQTPVFLKLEISTREHSPAKPREPTIEIGAGLYPVITRGNQLVRYMVISQPGFCSLKGNTKGDGSLAFTAIPGDFVRAQPNKHRLS